MKQIIHTKQNDIDHTNIDNYKNHVRFYLATDNPTVKDYVRQHHSYNLNIMNENYKNEQQSSSSSSSIGSIPVYVTDIQPNSYLRGNMGDRTALLELYLLSQCDGIVVNTLSMIGYNGTAHPISQYAMFAKKIGFISNSNFYQCSLE
jgi:hypothetical protein